MGHSLETAANRVDRFCLATYSNHGVAGVRQSVAQLIVGDVLSVLRRDGDKALFKAYDNVRRRGESTEFLLDTLGAECAHEAIDLHLYRCRVSDQRKSDQYCREGCLENFHASS